jgi:hypothetical protein
LRYPVNGAQVPPSAFSQFVKVKIKAVSVRFILFLTSLLLRVKQGKHALSLILPQIRYFAKPLVYPNFAWFYYAIINGFNPLFLFLPGLSGSGETSEEFKNAYPWW